MNWLIPLGQWAGFRLDHVYWVWFRRTGRLDSYDTSTIIGSITYMTINLIELAHWRDHRQLQLFRP